MLTNDNILAEKYSQTEGSLNTFLQNVKSILIFSILVFYSCCNDVS
jgi:hypothetical protein